MLAPLDGVRVVEFGQYIAGPAATQALADLGAEVIKVEPLTGEASRHLGIFGDAIWRSFNVDKQAIAVDLKSTQGRDLAVALAGSADIVVQNLRPGAADRLGLGARALRSTHPTLVHASITGFGSSGPGAGRSGYDIAAQAESGMMWINGAAGGDPTRVGFPVVDIAVGAICAQAVLGSYIGRLRHGTGATVETSLLEVALHLLGPAWSEYFTTGKPPIRTGNGQVAVAPGADLVPTADGWIVLSAYSVEHFLRLAQLVGRPGLVDDPRFVDNPSRVAHRPELLAILGEYFGALSTQDAVAALDSVGLVGGAVRDFPSVLESPDVQHLRPFRLAVGSHGERSQVVRTPWRFPSDDLEPAEPPTAPEAVLPAVGQHTVAVLTGLGLSGQEIARLQESNIVGIHDPS